MSLKPTSGGIAKVHMAIPAVPPARIIAPRLSSEGDAPAGVRALFVTSYAAKYLFVVRSELVILCLEVERTYAALPGPSRANVAPVPRKILRTPPSL